VQFAFDESTSLSSVPAVDQSAVPKPSSGWRRLASYAAVLLVGVTATAIGAWAIVRMNARAPQGVRFSIVPPSSQPLLLISPGSGGTALDRAIAITPDGSRLLYRAGDNGDSVGVQMMVRPIDQLEARPLVSIGPFREPVLSPDGRWIAFFGQGGLYKVSITGGPAISICPLPTGTGDPRGLSWGDDDTLFFATTGTSGAEGIFSVPAGGGDSRRLARPDPSRGEAGLFFPSALPGGRGVLVTIRPTLGLADNGQIALLDPRTGQRRILVRGGAHAQYVESGHLVYAAAGSLRAVPFDLDRLEVVGDPVPVVDGVAATTSGEAQFAVSRTGTLIYVPSTPGTAAAAKFSLVWVTRQGREEPIPVPPRAYIYPRISPDGTRLALDVRDQENDIWIWDLKRQTMSRLTFDPGLDRMPLWSHDGRRVFFASQRGGVTGGGNIFWQAADGTGVVERLTTSTNAQFPMSISPDGTRLVFREDAEKSRRDSHVLSLDGNRQVQPLVQTPFDDENGEISPDGQWLAYQSNESGQNQVYVRPFPKVDGGRWQISTTGGSRPAWAHSGRELFYLDATNVLMAVPVRTTPTFSAGNPAKVFETRYLVPNNGRTYDVSPDGQRFVMIKDTAADDRERGGAPPNIVVVLNWFEELKQRVPVK
jgi:serine/threonine-protein kinase